MKTTTRKNKVGIAQVDGVDVAAMAGPDVVVGTDPNVAERSGDPDKDKAVSLENARPKVSTYTPEARVWIESNKELNTEGLYGQRGRIAVRPEDIQNRAQFLGRPLTMADLEEIHGSDTTARSTVVNCPTC